MPRTSRGRSSPVEMEKMELEYDVYGWFKFESDAEGVRRLGRQWVQVEQMAEDPDWVDKEDEFDARVVDLRRPFL